MGQNMSTLRRNLPLLKEISEIPFEQQGVCIANLKSGTLNTLCSCMRQVLNGQGAMKMSDEDTTRLRDYLKPYKSKLKVFVNPQTSLVNKRNLLRKKGGAIFTSIIAALLPLLISKIVSLVSGGKKKTK